MNIKFSIIVVSLNAGSDLEGTINSILNQSYPNYEIIVKDGLSSDGSIESLPNDNRIKIIKKEDAGIYDAMNQAIHYISGDYILFINCGDILYNREVLNDIAKEIEQKPGDIYYGDTCYGLDSNIITRSPKKITRFVCYRTTICHQACIYSKGIFDKYKYDITYKICADHTLFIKSFLEGNKKLSYIPVVIASYKGDGFSETSENKRKQIQERKKMMKQYYSTLDIVWYKMILLCSLVSVRRWMSESKQFSSLYNRIKAIMYRMK